MSDCKNLMNKDVFNYIIKIMPDDIREEFKNELINCDEMTGGKRKKKSRRKMRGGDPAFRKKLIVSIYLFLGIVVSYIIGTANTSTLVAGFQMLWSGQCSSVSELALDYFGIGNPICNLHHRMIVLVGCALKGKMEAVMQIVGLASTAIASPLMIHAAINQLAGMIESRVGILLGQPGLVIEDQQSSQVSQIDQVDPMVAASVAQQIIEQIRNTPGLVQQINSVIRENRPELSLDEGAIEEVHASSQPNTQEEDIDLSGGKRLKTKYRRGTRRSRKHKKHKKHHTRKHKKHTRKYRRK
jgi:hypothetical protein